MAIRKVSFAKRSGITIFCMLYPIIIFLFVDMDVNGTVAVMQILYLLISSFSVLFLARVAAFGDYPSDTYE